MGWRRLLGKKKDKSEVILDMRNLTPKKIHLLSAMQSKNKNKFGCIWIEPTLPVCVGRFVNWRTDENFACK